MLDEEKHADGNALVESTPHAAANANVAPKSAKKSKSKKEVPAVPAEPAPVSTPAAPSYAATAASPSASSPLANGSGAVRTNAERRQESARKAETVADDMVDRDVDRECPLSPPLPICFHLANPMLFAEPVVRAYIETGAKI